MELDGKVALITGGGGGIGKATARRLLEEGASVVLNSRRREVLNAAQAELDPRVSAQCSSHVTRADQRPRSGSSRPRSSASAPSTCSSTAPASSGRHRFLEQTEEQLEEALDSILRPTFYVAQAAARAMIARGEGAIVSVGSMWAIDAITATPTSAYSAAQAGRHALTKNLAIELAPHGIRVNAVALAFVETPAYIRFMTPEQAHEVLESVNGFHSLGRHGYPEGVVEAILFLASERAGWITG